MKGNINVLVVEDSPVAQLLLVHILNSDPHLTVVGAVDNGEEALAFIERNTPDVVVMDINLPGIDGYVATRRIMETRPVPIVICSANVNPAEVAETFRAIEAGAVAAVAKPFGPGHPDHERTAYDLVETVRLMSEVKVVKRWPKTDRTHKPTGLLPAERPAAPSNCKVVAIGASTGGPPVLQTILAGLPGAFPVPLLIVQHIAPGFLPGLVDWIHQTTGVPIQIAAHGETPLPGRAYLAPDGYHMGLGANGQIALSRQAPENGLRPAVSYLFRSVAASYGANAVAVLLSGMGKDGASELKRLKDLGAVTIAQDEESSVVHGMPGEAIRLGAAGHVLNPEKIAALLTRLTANTSNEASHTPRR